MDKNHYAVKLHSGFSFWFSTNLQYLIESQNSDKHGKAIHVDDAHQNLHIGDASEHHHCDGIDDDTD